MDLYILRHGKAEEAGPGMSDRDRKLSRKGRDDTAAAAYWMAERGLKFDLIATSPLVRARETATIIAGQLGKRDCMVTWEELAPGGTPDEVCHRIREHEARQSVMVVGHEPLLSALISRIISGNEDSAVALPKGALAKIRDFSFARSPAGELHWLLPTSLMETR